MKAITILNRIKEKGSCCILDAENLTRALHREGKLDENKAIRFRPLYSCFDIVNADLWSSGQFNAKLCEGLNLTIDDLITRFA